MIKTFAIFGTISVSSYVLAAVIAQSTHTDILTLYSVGIFGGVVIAAMRLQRLEDNQKEIKGLFGGLLCQTADDKSRCALFELKIKEILVKLGVLPKQ